MGQRSFGPDALANATEWLRAQSVARPLLLSGRSRRHVDRLVAELDGLQLRVFDGARVHVPRETVDAAAQALLEHNADALIAIGGGSVTGLAKALRLDHELPFLALPTTYSGSELTNIYGITEHGRKTTGRDDRVRPDVVAYVPAFTRQLPRDLSIQSLLNAMAHPLSALSTGELDEPTRGQALRAVANITDAAVALASWPDDDDVRELATRAAADAADVLSVARLGAHHRVAHAIGGRLGAPHAALHSVLLPHFVAANPGVATDLPIPPSELFDLLVRVGAPTSLKALDIAWAQVQGALEDALAVERAWVRAAYLGRRPSQRIEVDPGADPWAVWGVPLTQARRVVVALHGRQATSDSIVQRARELLGDAPGTTVLAPQADDNVWYPHAYRRSRSTNAAGLDAALETVDRALAHARAEAPDADLHLLGFSQGACLGLEVIARRGDQLRSAVLIAGSRLGPDEDWPIAAPLHNLTVLMGIATRDPYILVEHVEATTQALAAAGAQVEAIFEPGGAHEISGRHRAAARRVLGVDGASPLRGFGNAHSTEALPGALPLEQNSPRPAPYGLYAEQLNGTRFVGPRHTNLRSWLYRIRPTAGTAPFHEVAHPTLTGDITTPPEPSLAGWSALPVPDAPTDFVDGLRTLAGAGSAAARSGVAIHLYVANRSMEHRTFYSADGDLVVLPELGALTLRTELGLLDVAPGTIAIIPAGLRFSVLLQGGQARGTVGEVFGRHFRLPERGPVGSNALADARHFQAPAAWFEDRPDVGHRITAKVGNRLVETTQDHSPFDVVAWHGNYAPYTYDLSLFSPVANVRVDHPDPSIYTVIGAEGLDLVVFPPRWDPTEHTFRPPFFHRNAVTELNGIIRSPSTTGPFQAGAHFLTPAMTGHGPSEASSHRGMTAHGEAADKPTRTTDSSIWWQFETTFALSLSPWAQSAANRVANWPATWGQYRKYYAGPRTDGDPGAQP